jgi:5-methylcytosine-specific restriction endonuclease McrA
VRTKVPENCNSQPDAVRDESPSQLRQLLEEHPLCEYCRLPVAWDVSLDHRQPINRGGRHQLANLAVCCSRCNAIKGQLAEAEFRQQLTLLASLHPTAAADLERRLLSGGKRYRPNRSRRR